METLCPISMKCQFSHEAFWIEMWMKERPLYSLTKGKKPKKNKWGIPIPQSMWRLKSREFLVLISSLVLKLLKLVWEKNSKNDLDPIFLYFIWFILYLIRFKWIIVNQCNVAIGGKFVYCIYLTLWNWWKRKILEPEVKQNLYCIK